MKELKGRVAVITGGASGLGLAMAERFAAEGMKLVLADIEPTALEAASAALRAKGAEVLAVKTDVTKPEQIEALADAAFAKFGNVHILCNNAGVASAGLVWERTPADWDWVLGVNLLAVIHGIRLFVPRMLKAGDEGHIVNTASVAGLISAPLMATYNVTKHGVVTLSETLYHELKMVGAKVGCSVLCPAWVKTRIAESERNRPSAFQNAGSGQPGGPMAAMLEQTVKQLLDASKITPAHVAERVLRAVQNHEFYILTHEETGPVVRTRMEDILGSRNPTAVQVA